VTGSERRGPTIGLAAQDPPDVLAGVAGDPDDVGLAYAADRCVGDGGRQLKAPLLQRVLGSPERSRGLDQCGLHDSQYADWSGGHTRWPPR
jgi:hypothetical protein